MNYCCFDIETIANENAPAYYDKFASSLAPKNIKDPKKIADSIAKKKSKAALSWWTGQVIAIGATIPGYEPQCFIGNIELDILCNFRDFLYKNDTANDLTLIGKSSANFDIPYLVGRYLKYDMGIPKQLMQFRALSDVDHMFSRSMACSQVSKLTDYAWGLGIEGKSGDGSEVAGMWERGEHVDIRDYCVGDVRIVSEMLRRYRESDKYYRDILETANK